MTHLPQHTSGSEIAGAPFSAELGTDHELLRRIVEGTARATGEEFFRALVRNLAIALLASFAFIAEVGPARDRVRTLALWGHGSFQSNVEYLLRLRLEGRLTAPWVREFERAAAQGSGAALRLHATPLVSGLLQGKRLHAPDLAERLLAGDPDVDEELVRTYGGRMLATARRLLADDAAAARAVQAAFRSAFELIERIASSDQIWTQLLELTVRAALVELRARPKSYALPTLLPRFTRQGVRKLDAADAGFARADAEDLLQSSSREGQALVRSSIERLPGKLRAALLLCDVEGCETSEAGRFLGLDVATTKKRLHHARQALRTLLGRAFAEHGAELAGRPL